MAFSFLAYLFSFWRYARLCYANEESDDVVGGVH